MSYSTSSIWRLTLLSIFFSSLVAGQFNVEYCSTVNTADTAKNSSVWQSNGLCYNFCQQNYAFAVVQADGCWCSNFIPASTSSGCTETCPGYPAELCGGLGLYGYIELLRKPSGTRGAIRVSSTTTTPRQTRPTATSSPSSPAVVILPPEPETTQVTSTSLTSSSTSTSADDDTTTTSPSTLQRPSSTWTPTPVISLETVTGQVRTVTVTPTQRPDQQNANLLPTSQGKGGFSTGAAVGLTVGLVALVAIVAGVAWFCLKKRRKQKEVEYVDTSRESMSAAGGPIPSRSMSENSRYVLGTDGRQVVEHWEPDDNQAGQRKSRLIPVDQRLDPFSPVYTHNINKSRESVNTIRDDHDYSRRVASKPVLRTTNPD